MARQPRADGRRHTLTSGAQRVKVGHRVVLVAILVALALVPSAAADVWLLVDENGVNVDQVELGAGETVHWSNDGGTPVTVAAGSGLFDSGPIPSGGAFSVRMPVPGDHAYTVSSAGHSEAAGLRVRFTSLPGPSSARVNDHLPNLPFPPLPAGDLGVHPKFGLSVSKTRILLRFADDATVAQANAAIQAANVKILGAIPDLGVVLVGAPSFVLPFPIPGIEFFGLTGALQSLGANPAVETASMSPEMIGDVVPRRAEKGIAEATKPKCADFIKCAWTWERRWVDGSPLGTGGNWGLEASRFPQAWNLKDAIAEKAKADPAHRVRAGVVDVGFSSHPDLPTLTYRSLCATPTNCTLMTAHDHGTHVAGTIGAAWNDDASAEPGRSSGVSGANPSVEIEAVSASFAAKTDLPLAVQAMSLFLDNIAAGTIPNVRVINYSMGFDPLQRYDKLDANDNPVGERLKWWDGHPARDCGPGAHDDVLPGGDWCTPNNDDTWLASVRATGEIGREVAKKAREANVTIVQSAGNEGNKVCVPNGDELFPAADLPCDPAKGHLEPLDAKNIAVYTHSILEPEDGSDEAVIIVENIQRDRSRAESSNLNGEVSAPGTDILSTVAGGHELKTGTSMAAPHVTALVSYLLAYDPSMTPKEVKQHVLDFARPDTSGGAKARIDAYSSLVSIPGAARDLVDVNDLSPDGSRRAVLKKDGTQVADKRKVVPDGVIDMRDFRAFRDAWMTTCLLDRGGEGCPPDSVTISLNELPDNIGFDLNGDGCVVVINPVAPCTEPTPESIFPRHDYNGDGSLDGAQGNFARVPLKPDGSPASNWFEMTPMSDLGVLQSQWPSNTAETDGWGSDDLDDLMWSGDIEVHAEALHKLGAKRVEVSVEPLSGGEAVPELEFDADDAAVVTAPVETGGTTYTVNASAEIGGETVHTAPVDVTLGFGEDVRVDLCATALELTASGRLLTAGSGATVAVTATLSGCDGALDVEGRIIGFAISPAGAGHATLAPNAAFTDVAGQASTTFTTGEETGEYELTASFEVSENHELTATTTIRVGAAMKIAYIWRQQVYDWHEGGVPGLTNRWAPTPGMPDCAQVRSYCIDGFFLGLSDGDSDGFSMTRAGTISGGGSDLRLTEQVLDYDGYAAARWTKVEHEGQTSTGSDTITYRVENPTAYTDYDLGGKLRADDDADGVRLRGLKEIAELPYTHRRTGSQQNFPPELWDFYHRFMLGPRGDGSALKFHADVDRAVFFPRQQGGELGTYAYCGAATEDLTTEPGYLLIDDDDWVGNGLIGDRTKTYQDGLLPMPYGPGSVKYRWSFAAVAYYSDDDAPTLELPDCTASTEPEADFSFTPGEPGEGRVVQFTDLSKDAENDLESWHWDFGDGTTGEGETPHHLYDDNGTYTIQLTIADSQGHSASVTKQVEVRNLPPVAGLDDAVIQVGSPLRLRARSVDPGKLDKQSLGLRLTSTNPDFALVEIANAQAIHGIEVLNLLVGSYPLTLTVTDKDGATATAKALVVVTAAPAPPPPPTPPGGPTCDPNVSLDGEAQIFLDEVNAYRLQNGLVAVGASPTLTIAARRHADDMAENEFLAHEGSDGSTPHERAEDAGYTGSSTSENVARGLDTGVEVLFGWQSSVTGHNEAMLEPAWRAVGIARAQSGDGEWFWATTYGNELDCGEQAQALASFAAKIEATASFAEDEPELAYPPVPALTVSTEYPTAGRPMTFVNRSRDSAGTPIGATLSFGDGTASVELAPGESVEHAYTTNEGSLNATLDAVDAAGVHLVLNRQLYVLGPPAPELEWIGDLQGVVDGTATVGGLATDPGTDAPIAGLTLTFRIGSATASAVTGPDGRATTQLSLAGLAGGDYVARVTFAGNEEWGAAEAHITFQIVANTPPIADAGGPYVLGLGADLLLDGSRSDDQDDLDHVVSWNWDLDGDGAFDDLAGSTPRPVPWDELQSTVCGGTCVPNHAYPVALRVVDGFGVTGDDATTVSFTSDFAILLASGDAGKTLVPGASNSFSVSVIGSGGFTHPVALTVEGLPPGITATWTNNPVTPTGIAILKLTASQNAANGSFPIVVTGTGGGITHTVDDSIEVAFGLIPICTTSVTGTVRDETTGDPIEGATVRIGSLQTTTSDSGRYTLNNVPLGLNNAPRTHIVSSGKAGWFTKTTTTLAVCGATSTANLTLLARQTGRVSGRVVVGLADPNDHTPGRHVQPTNDPVPQATVHTVGVGDTDADADGRYAMDLALSTGNTPADYTLLAHAPGYWDQTKHVTVELGVPKTVDFELVRTCTARVTGGVVRWRDTGEPAAGASVRLDHGITWNTAVADANGVYRFDLDVLLGYNNSARTFPLTSSVPDGAPFGATGERSDVYLEDCGDERGADLWLNRPSANFGDVEGTLTDEETGAPLANAFVSVDGAGSVLTDANGIWRFDHVFVGFGNETTVTRSAQSSPDGYWSTSKSFELNANATAHVELVALKRRYGAVAGTVRDLVTGAPIAGASVGSCFPGSICATTGPDGSYAQSGLPLGPGNDPVNIGPTATAAGYWPQSRVGILEADETTQLDFELLKKCAPARIVGIVVNAETQQPIENAVVSSGSQAAHTNPAGRFELINIQPGAGNTPLEVDLTASASGFFSQTKRVTIFCGATIVVDFGRRETQLGTIVGTVTAGGQPLDGVFVGSEFGGSATTGADGSYRITGVPLGDLNADREWSVSIAPTGFQPQSKTVVAKANEEVRADFVLAANVAPTATPLTVATRTGESVAIQLAGTDPDGDALQFVVISQPEHGTLTDVAPALTYAPAAGYAGPDTFTFRVTDGVAVSPVVSVDITVRSANQPPVAADSTATTDEDTAVTLTFGATDPDGDTLIRTIVAGPAHGTLDGTSYMPAANYHGPDSVTFRVSDGTLMDEATVAIDVRPVNDAPTVELAPAGPVDEGASLALSASGADGDGGELAYSWQASAGGLVGNGAAATLAAADGPAEVTVSVTITDASGLHATATRIVEVRNVAPSVDAGADTTSPWGIAVAFAGSITDPSTADTAAGLAPRWAFGDGAEAAGALASHAYQRAGSYTGRLSARDRDGGEASDTRALEITRRTTQITVVGYSAGRLSAALEDVIDPATARLAGRALVFDIAGQTLAASTDSTGLAAVNIQLSEGTHAVAVRFAGDDDYLSSQGAASVVVGVAAPTGSVTGYQLQAASGGTGKLSAHYNKRRVLNGYLEWKHDGIRYVAAGFLKLEISADGHTAVLTGILTDGRPFRAELEDGGPRPQDDRMRLVVAGNALTGDGRLAAGKITIAADR